MDDGHICDIQLNVSECDGGYGPLQWFEVVEMSRNRGGRKVNMMESWDDKALLLAVLGELDVSLARRTRRSCV